MENGRGGKILLSVKGKWVASKVREIVTCFGDSTACLPAAATVAWSACPNTHVYMICPSPHHSTCCNPPFKSHISSYTAHPFPQFQFNNKGDPSTHPQCPAMPPLFSSTEGLQLSVPSAPKKNASSSSLPLKKYKNKFQRALKKIKK